MCFLQLQITAQEFNNWKEISKQEMLEMEKGNIIMIIGAIIVLIIGLFFSFVVFFGEPATDLNTIVYRGFGVTWLILTISFASLLIGSALFKYEK
jgi:uncharacterized membrane protein